MKSRVLFPIRWKLLIPTLVICGGAGVMGYQFLKNSWDSEHEKLLVDFSLKRLKSVSEQMETRLQMRFRDLERVCQAGYRAQTLSQKNPSAAIFDNAGPELKKELLGVSFFQPESSGKVNYYQFVQWKLVQQANLPRDIVDQLNKKYPLDIRALLKNPEVRFFNRTILSEHGEPIPVITLAFFGRGMSPLESKTLILADLRGDFLSENGDNAQLGEVFWMKRDGTILSHPSASLMLSHAERPMAYQARPLLEKATAFGEHTVFARDGENYIATVVPTAVEDVFAVSEIALAANSGPLANLSLGIGVCFLGLVSCLIFFQSFVAGRLTSRIRRIEVSINEISQGYIPSRRNRYFDEFAVLVNAIDNLANARVGQLGQASKTDSIQLKTEKEAALEPVHFSEVLQVETTQIAFFQAAKSAKNPTMIWDVSRLGNKVWFLLGNAGGDIGQAESVVQTTKKTLPGVRAVKGTKETNPLSEQVTQLNKVLFEAFKGKAWLNLTAVELHLDSGKIAVIHAANEAPLLIPSKLTPSPDGTTGTDWISLMEPKAMMDSSVAVGSRGDNTFKPWEEQLVAQDSFCIFQKDSAATTGPLSFRPEIRNLILRNGCASVKELRQNIVYSPAKALFQTTLTVAIVQFGGAKAAKPAAASTQAPAAEKSIADKAAAA
jgi:hypothetical protein